MLGWIGWAGNVLVLIHAVKTATGDDILELHLHTDDPASDFALFSIGGMILWLLAGSTTLDQTPRHRRQFIIHFATLLAALLGLGSVEHQ